MYQPVARVFYGALVAAFSTQVLAHEGHGASAIHLHGWEYALLAATIASVLIYAMKK